jgi:hypothetical protein
MRRSHAANLLAILLACVLVALSVSFKVYAWDPNPGVAPDVKGEVAKVMDLHGFHTGPLSADPPSIYADRGNCHVKVALPSYDGYHQDLIRQIAGTDDVLFLFEGERFASQPTLRTRLAYFWHKAMTTVGIKTDRSVPLAIISSPGCDDIPIADLEAVAH